ncbi:MAG: hypothetical protein GY847_13180 [Proteobacteria bacterium]|nr:hypothetical protein [Pseudomonadota bacterium]
MRKIIPCIAILLLPVSAMAQKIAVLPVSYTMVWTGAKNDELAEKLQKKIVDEAMKLGYETIDSAAVAQAVAQTGKEECKEKTCVAQVNDSVSADEAVFVSVRNNDDVEFMIEAVFAKGEGISEVKAGSRTSVMEWIARKVIESLPEVEQPVKPEQPESDEEPEHLDSEEDSRKPVAPVAFWTSFGVTAGLVVGWAVVEGIAYKKLDDYSDKPQADRTNKERDEIKSWRIASRVLLGTMAAGAITTTVLGFFTDFKKSDDSTNVSLAPAWTQYGGALMLQGSF